MSVVEKAKAQFVSLKDKAVQNVDYVKGLPAELKAKGTWEATQNLLLKQVSVGLAAGLAVGVVLFRESSARVR
jgi:hypothetical protein